MYDKYTWVTGEVITEDKLNHIEDGISDNDTNKTTSSQASFAASPASTRQDISVGATGSTLSAPGNGEVSFGGKAKMNGSYVGLSNSSGGMHRIHIFTGVDQIASTSVRCSEGQTLKYQYFEMTDLVLRFTPNNGDV